MKLSELLCFKSTSKMTINQLNYGLSEYNGMWYIHTPQGYLHSDHVIRSTAITDQNKPTGYYATKEAAIAMLSPQERANLLGRALCPVEHGSHTDYVNWEPGMPTRNLIIPEIEVGYWWVREHGNTEVEIVKVGKFGVYSIGYEHDLPKHRYIFLQKVNSYDNVQQAR